ncbi:MAG: hypothetical protein ABL903_10870 [Methylococcales bacterium]
MPWYKIINIIGIILEIFGVFILSRLDINNRKIDATFDQIPGNHFIDEFESELRGDERNVSPAEEEFNKLSEASNPVQDLRQFRVGLRFIGMGIYWYGYGLPIAINNIGSINTILMGFCRVG